MSETYGTYKGQPLTDELGERLAAEALAELDAMSDEEIAARTVSPGTRRGRAEGSGEH